MSGPLISVCVVTYNQESFIKDCLTSVLAQYPDMDMEILVGDDASTDGTSEIIGQVASASPGRIEYFRHDRNLGPAGNYRFLIERARGEFIAHLDGDDFWMPGKLAQQVAFLRAHPECAAVYTNAAVISDDRRLLGVFNNELPETFDLGFLLRKGNFLNHSSLVYRSKNKDAILSIAGGFIDYRIHIRLARRGMLGYLNQVLVCYRAAVANSMVNTIPNVVRELYWEALLDEDAEFVGQGPLSGAMSYFYSDIVYAALRRGHIGQVVSWGKRIVQESPTKSVPVLCWGILLAVARALSVLKAKALRVGCGNSLQMYFRR